MKKKIYILSFIFFLNFITSNSFSQSFKSIFASNFTTWDIIYHGYCDWIESHTIVAVGDTTIDSNNYKIISGLGGFLREDTLQGKVWFYDTSYNAEYLVMNLGLDYGDMFTIYDYYNVASTFSVDSIYYKNTLKHVRINAWTSMCGLDEKITFIEGSGPTSSFTYQRDLNGNSVNSYLVCHFKDGIKVLGNQLFYDSCNIFEVGIAENKSGLNTVNIFPNPASDIINVDIDNKDNEHILLEIYNVMGILVKIEIIANQQKQIDIGDLKDGLYLITTMTKDIISKQRLLIQR